jgi:hypothetical protein
MQVANNKRKGNMRTMRYRAQTELAQQMSAKRQTTESRAKKEAAAFKSRWTL